MKMIVMMASLLMTCGVAKAQEISGTYSCEGPGVLQLNIVGDPAEDAQIRLVVDFDKNSVSEISIEARIPYKASDISIKWNEEDQIYHHHQAGHGYRTDLGVKPVFSEDRMLMKFFLVQQYQHYAAGYTGGRNFDYDTKSLVCAEI